MDLRYLLSRNLLIYHFGKQKSVKRGLIPGNPLCSSMHGFSVIELMIVVALSTMVASIVIINDQSMTSDTEVVPVYSISSKARLDN